MKKFGLNKKDKLCNSTAIDYLFSRSENDSETEKFNSIAYPLRAVWTVNKHRQTGSQIQFFISVPKKRLHHAVDRVKMRRRIRESYRLNHHSIILKDKNIDLAFIYIADTLKEYADIEKSMLQIFFKIETALEPKL